MNRKRFDENIVIGILSGGMVSVLSGAMSVDIKSEIIGIGVMMSAVIYALARRDTRKKPVDLEQIWEDNRESVVRFFLSVVDDDVVAMTPIFKKLELDGVIFSSESSIVSFGVIGDVEYNMFKERFDKLPLLQNILGFITYEQYIAVYDYLKYGKMFIDFIYNNQTYQRDLLILKAKGAQRIQELFRDEENNHQGLKEWSIILPHFKDGDII